MSANDDDYSWGAEIGKGVLTNAGVSLLGYGLSSLGIGFPDATGDAIAKLQSQLNLIENQIVSLKTEMDDVKNELNQESYTDAVGRLDSIMNSISQAATDLKCALLKENMTEQSSDKTTIMNEINNANLQGQLSVIHEGVTGPVNGVSLYQLLSNLIKVKHRFLTRPDYLAVKNQLDYYQNAQYTQLWLAAEYLRANGSPDLIQNRIDTVQANLQQEQSQFQLAQSYDGVVYDQKTTLMLYVADCPYTDFKSAQDFISQLNSQWVDRVTWRLPTVAELLGNDDIWGLFSDYDSKDGTPPQWLTNNGFPTDMTGIHFWTSDQVPAPDPNDILYQWHDDGMNNPIAPRDYNADLWAWQAGGPPQYCVDSANLDHFGVNMPDSAHVVAVALEQRPQPLIIIDSEGNYPWYTNRKADGNGSEP